MVTNPLTVDFGGYSPRRMEGDPTFGQTLSATLGYTYDPIVESIKGYNQFGSTRQEGYNPFDDLGDHGLFAMHLRHATSPEHMVFLKRGIDESIDRRRILSESSFTSQLVAGLFDPLNLVALPLGGPTVGLGRSALRVGAGTAAIQAGIEGALIQPNDPVQSATESMYNIVGAGLFGAAFGGAISVPLTARARAFKKAEADLEEFSRSLRMIENASEVTASDLSDLSNAIRPHEDLSPVKLSARISDLTKKKEQIELQRESQSTTALEAEYVTVQNAISAHRRESGIRQLISEGYTPEKLWSIADNRFTDSAFYRFVSTPFKRVLQSSTATGMVKEAMVRLAGDSGINLVANTLGIASPLSVHQRAAARNGEWVKAHDQLIKFFREDMGLLDTSVMDIDVVQAYRSVARRSDSYGNWLRGINQKRTTKSENLTDIEKKSIKVIDDFFQKAERELQDVGLIGSKKSIQDRLNYLNRTLAGLEDEIASVSEPRLLARLQSRKNSLLSKQEEAQASLDNFDDTQQTTTDKFLPRFWDEKAIRRDRAKFESILRKWYFENPTIWRLEGGKWVKKYLGTDKSEIDKRVKDTIDGILNESDPTSEGAIGYGYGRSKHFRHRQLDIPNELVWDFMMQDPIAIMKTYTARIAPRLEFKKQFDGQELDDVVFNLEREMIKKGVSDREMQKHMRDFNLMYDRIAGAVLRNPSALNQRIAYVMKEAAATNYMGSGWIAAVPEFGRILMEHDGSTMIKSIAGALDRDTLKMSVNETRLSGEAIDILKGSAFARLVDDMANNVDASEFWNKARNAFYTLNGLGPLTQLSKTLDGIARGHTIIDRSIKLKEGRASSFEKEWLARYGIDKKMAAQIARAPWQQGNNKLYLANTEEWLGNFLIPEIEGKTVKVVEFNEDGSRAGYERDGVYIPARYNKKTNTIFFDREYIEDEYFNNKVWLNPRREGIKPMPDIFKTPKDWSNFVMLHEIMHTRSKQKKGESFADYENRINELALAEYKAQSKLQQETVDTFRSALNSGILNTILAATPADRPIINDGVVFVPHYIAKRFGYKEDSKIKGYSRIENGFLGLPFQFYSYTLANVNKMVGAFAHGQLKNRTLGLTTMIGLGYLSTQMRYSLSGAEFAWNDMSAQDRFARAWDASGVTALYSDLFYQSLHTSLSLGGPNITNGFIQPKFPQKSSYLEEITGIGVLDEMGNIAGAGVGISLDLLGGGVQFANGEYGEGAKNVVRNLPFARMWFWKDDMNAITRMWAQ